MLSDLCGFEVLAERRPQLRGLTAQRSNQPARETRWPVVLELESDSFKTKFAWPSEIRFGHPTSTARHSPKTGKANSVPCCPGGQAEEYSLLNPFAGTSCSRRRTLPPASLGMRRVINPTAVHPFGRHPVGSCIRSIPHEPRLCDVNKDTPAKESTDPHEKNHSQQPCSRHSIHESATCINRCRAKVFSGKSSAIPRSRKPS
jgi:hypothetical protein